MQKTPLKINKDAKKIIYTISFMISWIVKKLTWSQDIIFEKFSNKCTGKSEFKHFYIYVVYMQCTVFYMLNVSF